MNDTTSAVLDAIDAAPTAGAALDAIPEDWSLFVAGPEAGDWACSILPAGAGGPPERIWERGLAMGRGDTKLEAMRQAVTWLRTRMLRVTPPEAVRDPT